jgi:cyclophilin family peptidyl-prolyl cis-trans isomerase
VAAQGGRVIRRLAPLVLAGLAALAVPRLAAAQTGTDQAQPRLSDERILLRTTRGDLVLALYPDVAPRHAAQILKLVRLGVYDSTWFQRVEPGYIVQLINAQNGKRPLSPEQLAAITKLPAEFSKVPHRPGTLSMAREPADPNSAETSFSILLRSAPHLDGKYTVFGEVVWGMPLVNMLSTEPRDSHGIPADPPVVAQALVLTAQEVATRQQAGQLREPVPLSPAAAAKARQRAPLRTAALLLILLCNLALAFLGTRWQPRVRATVSGVAALVGVLLLIAQYAG